MSRVALERERERNYNHTAPYYPGMVGMVGHPPNNTPVIPFSPLHHPHKTLSPASSSLPSSPPRVLVTLSTVQLLSHTRLLPPRQYQYTSSSPPLPGIKDEPRVRISLKWWDFLPVSPFTVNHQPLYFFLPFFPVCFPQSNSHSLVLIHSHSHFLPIHPHFHIYSKRSPFLSSFS